MSVLLDTTHTFDPDERATLTDVVWALQQVRTPAQFEAWTQTELQSVFPHGALICGVGYTNKPTVQMIDHISVNFPMAYMEDIRLADGGVLSPIMDRWLKDNEPQLFDPSQAKHEGHQEWLDIFNKHDLRNIAAHGMSCNSQPISSYFNLSRIPEPLGPRNTFLLKFLAPQMHLVLTRILLKRDFSQQALPQNISPPTTLTSRENEILYWVSEGKTNHEIAARLFLSFETIKSHVKNILFKLGSKSRAEAIKRASEIGLFAPPDMASRIYSRHED